MSESFGSVVVPAFAIVPGLFWITMMQTVPDSDARAFLCATPSPLLFYIFIQQTFFDTPAQYQRFLLLKIYWPERFLWRREEVLVLKGGQMRLFCNILRHRLQPRSIKVPPSTKHQQLPSTFDCFHPFPPREAKVPNRTLRKLLSCHRPDETYQRFGGRVPSQAVK